jgi:hypothetical protein
MRYPNVFAAAYASEPMTDYATSGDGGGLDWRGDVEPKWGARALALPVSLDAPAGWAEPLQRYNGVNVWVWQNHRFNTTNRVGDDNVPFGMGHGTNDMIIEWPTQGQPIYGPLDASRRCWGGVVTDVGHQWLGFYGLPPTLAQNASLAPFRGFQVVRNETVPGFSRAGGNIPAPPAQTGGYNQNIGWSASWDAWDGPPTDTATNWQVSLRTEDDATHTVDVTPRRARAFRPAPGATARWRNLRVSDGAEVQSGTAIADAFGLITATNVSVTAGGNRLRFELVAEPPVTISSARIVGSGFRLSFPTTTNHQYAVECSPVLPAINWTPVATNLPGTGSELTVTNIGARSNAAAFYRVKRN